MHELILVDENDKVTGFMDKQKVHELGLLHRAFSIFIFNTNGEFLLQKRAQNKYHSGGLWSNTCCSHPVAGEELEDAIHRRLNEEMGIDCTLDFAFSFIYRAELEQGLIEHEFDHVYFGRSDDTPLPDPLEVEEWTYYAPEQLLKDVEQDPGKYSAWLRICLIRVFEAARAGNYFTLPSDKE